MTSLAPAADGTAAANDALDWIFGTQTFISPPETHLPVYALRAGLEFSSRSCVKHHVDAN